MGRFYKTDKPQQLDYMSKLPEQYLLMATQQAAQDVQKNEAALYDIYGKLQVNALPGDKADADKKLASYEDQINSLSASLQADPMAFRRKSAEITNLGRTLYKDMTRGELAAIQGNYNKDVEWQKTYQDMLKKGKLGDPQSVAALRSMNLSKFGKTGYDQASGNYNTYSPDELLPSVDVFKHLDSVVSKMKPQIINKESSYFMKDKAGDDQYIVTVGGETKTLSKGEILNVAMNELYSNSDVMASLKQRSDIGTMKGVYNKDELIKPFDVETVTDAKGNKTQKINWNKDSSIASSLQSIIDIYEVNDITKAKHEIKSVSGYGSGASSQYKGYVVDTENGRLTVSSTPAELNNLQNIDYNSVAKVVGDMKQAAFKNVLISAQPMIESVAKVLADKGLNGDYLLQLQDVLNINSEADLDNVTKKVNAILNQVEKATGSKFKDISRITDSLNAVDNQITKANNIQKQFELVQKTSQATGIPVKEIYANQKFNESTIKLVETNGDEYQGTDAKVFNGVVDEIKTKYKSTADLPDTFSILVEDNGKYIVKEVTKEDFRKQYGFTGSKAAVKSTTGDVNSFAKGGTGGTKTVSGTDKAELGDVTRVMDDLPTATLDGKGDVLNKPFKIRVESGKGTVSILLDEEVSNQEVRDLDSKYSYKSDYDKKVRDINKLVSGSAKAITSKNSDIEIDGVPEFELIDGVTYQPAIKGSDARGQIIFTYGDGKKQIYTDDNADALKEYQRFYNNK